MKSRKGRSGKVIHVVFGPGGGRARGRLRATPRDLATPEPEAAPITEVFGQAEASRLVGLGLARLRALDRAGLVRPSAARRGRRAYTFADLIVLRTVAGLLAENVRLRDVVAAAKALRAKLPRSTRPLAELRVMSDGKRVVVRGDDGPFEPISGQMLLDFDVKALEAAVVRELSSGARHDRQRRAYELYIRATELDESPGTMDQAEALYRKATELDPWLAIAFTNLGNIRFRRGEDADALELYERALAVDPQQPEAQYNVGYVLLDRGDPRRAIRFFEGAVKADGRFADAHFYLAMALESIGDTERAHGSWRAYLDLEPTGTWADIAKSHL